MIKMIKEGKTPSRTKRIYKTICPTCRCEFEFEEEDVTITRGENHVRIIINIECPWCGKIVAGRPDSFTYEDRPVEQKPYDLMTDENAWKIHPEYEPLFKKHDNYNYYDIHVDEYDWTKKFNWNKFNWITTSNLPDDYNDYISRINSIDNYKLPDDYTILKK